MTRPAFTLPTVSPEEAAECDRIVAAECGYCATCGGSMFGSVGFGVFPCPGCNQANPPASRARVDSAWPEGRHERGWPDSGGIARRARPKPQVDAGVVAERLSEIDIDRHEESVRRALYGPYNPEPFVDGQRRITIDATPEEVEEIWRRRCSDIDPGKAFTVYVTAVVCACVAVGTFAAAVTLGWVVVP